MAELLYESMTRSEAAGALEEFLAEHPAGLGHLRSVLAGHGVDPAVVLDGSVDSVVPLWEWITARVAEYGVDPRSLAKDPSRGGWPSWARHGMLVDSHPRAEFLALVVDAPDWDEIWLTLWLQRHLHTGG